eukprot:scaffold715_cov192-Alexandrium_tamarense.AAC.1
MIRLYSNLHCCLLFSSPSSNNVVIGCLTHPLLTGKARNLTAVSLPAKSDSRQTRNTETFEE